MNINKLGTIRQLEILERVYTLGSVTAAADDLNLSQPTLSMQLKKLADQNDVQLYNQVGKQLIFTEAGEIFVRSARRILQEMSTLRSELDLLHGLTKGTLKLAFVTSAKYFIPHLLGPFCERYPDIDIQLKVGNRQQVLERMNQADDDFYVFSHLPEMRNLKAIEFLPNPLIPIVAADHPLAAQPNLTLKDLLPFNYIAREPGSGTRYTIENYLKDTGVALTPKMTIESNEAIKHCVMSNLGFSILSAYTLSFGGDEGIAKLNVEGFPIPSHWSFVWPQEKRLSPIANVFLEYIDKEGRELLLEQLR